MNCFRSRSLEAFGKLTSFGLKLAKNIGIFLKGKETDIVNKMDTGRLIVSTQRKIACPLHASVLDNILEHFSLENFKLKYIQCLNKI